MKQTLHVYFTGRVQGVGFRRTTQIHAQTLKLTGWVKNLSDGRVEMVAEGEPETLEKLLKGLKEKFSITNITKTTVSPGGFTGFEIHR